MYQGLTEEIADMLLKGEADIAVATAALGEVAEFARFPFYSWYHAVIVPAGHPLEQAQPLSLAAIAEHPIITYQEGFTGRTRIAVLRGHYLRGFAYRFMELCSPDLTERVIRAKVDAPQGLG